MPLTSSSGDWNIRKAKADDAEALVDLFNRLGHETDFMLFEPGERNITVEEEAKRLESWEAASSGVVFIASGTQIVRLIKAFCADFQPIRRNLIENDQPRWIYYYVRNQEGSSLVNFQRSAFQVAGIAELRACLVELGLLYGLRR